jgi:bacterial/archaeal transporter family-2 protein
MPATLQLVLIAVAIIAGSCVALQQALNVTLRADLGSALWAALISYLGGAIILLAALLTVREPWPTLSIMAKSSIWSWTGGFFGAAYIFTSIMLLPRLGAMTVIVLLIAGQLLASVAFDHFGLFGLTQRPIDIYRASGAVLLMVGVLLIRR